MITMLNTYKLILDAESEVLAKNYLEFCRLGPEHLDGLILDAVMTGMLSEWLDAEQKIPCIDGVRSEAKRDVEPGEAVVALRLMPRARGDETPPAARAKGHELAAELGLPVEQVFLAATRVGLGKLQPPAPKAPPRGEKPDVSGEAGGKPAQAPRRVLRVPAPGSYVPPSVRVDLGSKGGR